MPKHVSLTGGALSLVPKRWVSTMAGRLLAHQMSKALIPWYIRKFSVDLADAADSPETYRSLLDLFIRRLRPGARPIDPREGAVVSPVDGTVENLGSIHRGTLIQAKGVNYSVGDLLGRRWPTDLLEGGSWTTLYLSPGDYHRIHLPLRGRPVRAVHIPGSLFPVNRIGTATVPGLFTRNERWVTTFATAAGTMYLVEIGSLIVGSVRLTYIPELHNIPVRRRTWGEWALTDLPALEKGEEIGHFAFGSTVILLFERGRVQWRPDLRPGAAVRVGQTLGFVRGIGQEEVGK
ncbi:MAG: archaetidylserine decarboxylase [Kyrpidia sp.]|nr:archaetidylserine decarboxylase [Kyrpidia sp.]